MRKILGFGLFGIFILLLVFPALAAPTWDRNPADFMHGIAVELDGEFWYFAGPGSIAPPNDVIDVPGHTWKQSLDNPYKFVGRHYNVGPWMAPSGAPWWASGEPYGVMLFKVHGRMAPWTEEIAAKMASKGYVHYHELVDASGNHHPQLVVWLKHTAIRSFYFDGGPMPGAAHEVKPGVDYEFMPNWMIPYVP